MSTASEMVMAIDNRINQLLGKPQKYTVQSETSSVLAEHYDLTQLLTLRRYYATIEKEEKFNGRAVIGIALGGK